MGNPRTDNTVPLIIGIGVILVIGFMIGSTAGYARGYASGCDSLKPRITELEQHNKVLSSMFDAARQMEEGGKRFFTK